MSPSQNFWSRIDYLALIPSIPLALYRDSLEVSKALIFAIGSHKEVPFPVLGYIQDIRRLWNLSTQELLADFSENHLEVASRRHGNTFPLANKALLTHARIIDRARDVIDVDQASTRPTTLHLTYITSRHDDSDKINSDIAHALLITEVGTLVVIAAVLFRYGIFIGAALVLCIVLSFVLLWLLQRFTSFIFGNGHALAQDLQHTTVNGAALDVHIAVRHSNGSDMDVLIGYSSQLYALTNIPVRIKNWKLVRFVARALVLILAIQFALLLSLAGRSDKQLIGSVVWFLCHLTLQISPRILRKRHLDVILGSQPAVLTRLSPLTFSGQRVALAFIGSLPMTAPRVGYWDWLDSFMPPNEQRREWETEIIAAGLLGDEKDVEVGKMVEKRTNALVDEVRSARSKDEYRRQEKTFLKAVQFGST